MTYGTCYFYSWRSKRAWTFKQGMKAPQCAGVIHTDFERGFIRAETVSYDDLMTNGSMTAQKKLEKYV